VKHAFEMILLMFVLSNCLDKTIIGFLGQLIKYVSKMKGCICDNFDYEDMSMMNVVVLHCLMTVKAVQMRCL